MSLLGPRHSIVFVLVLVLACSVKTRPAGSAQRGVNPPDDTTSGVPDDASGSAKRASVAGSGSTHPSPSDNGSLAVCSMNLPLKITGCPCTPGETFSCWTGTPDKRQVGKCHDGTQQCVANGQEFAAWTACTGEERDCGELPDAGPHDAGQSDCPCVPGTTVECDEDCSVGIFCSLSSAKTCLPDGTFGPCHETSDSGIPNLDRINMLLGTLQDSGINLLDPLATVGVCRSTFFGCASLGFSEGFSGDCSKQFRCGHAPSQL